MGDLRLAHDVLAEIFAHDPEPIPGWDEADQPRLETCRACIEIEVFGIKKYPDLATAVAKLFYSAVKLHIFPNGNKRFALVVSIMLLVKNGYTLTVPVGVGAEVAKWVAGTDPHDPATYPDTVIETLAAFYRGNIARREVSGAEGDVGPPDPN